MILANSEALRFAAAVQQVRQTVADIRSQV